MERRKRQRLRILLGNPARTPSDQPVNNDDERRQIKLPHDTLRHPRRPGRSHRIPLIKKTTSAPTYENDFKAVLRECKAKGAEGLVTGDIYEVAGHEEGWLGRVFKEVGLTPVKPLWMGDTKQIYLDYLKTGFKATVVRTNRDLSLDWLGRVLDRKFYDDILKLAAWTHAAKAANTTPS